jgi:thiol-disulfide isomerase/thioredoxin
MTALRRRALWVFAAVLGGAAGAALWQRREPQADGDAAIDLWSKTFVRADGSPLAMAAYRGKPLVLNFWATWCAPCIKELPEFDRFQRDHAARVNVVGLALDNAAAVQAFLAKHPLGLATALAGVDGSELGRSLGNSHGVLPFTAMFDAEGKLSRHKVGETSYDELRDWLGSI